MRFGAEFARQSKPRPKWPGFLSLQHGRDIGKRIISVGRQGDAISECRDSLEVATNVDQLTINCEWVIRRSMMCSLTLEYLAEQQRRMLADQRTMHDEMLVRAPCCGGSITPRALCSTSFAQSMRCSPATDIFHEVGAAFGKPLRSPSFIPHGSR